MGRTGILRVHPTGLSRVSRCHLTETETSLSRPPSFHPVSRRYPQERRRPDRFGRLWGAVTLALLVFVARELGPLRWEFTSTSTPSPPVRHSAGRRFPNHLFRERSLRRGAGFVDRPLAFRLFRPPFPGDDARGGHHPGLPSLTGRLSSRLGIFFLRCLTNQSSILKGQGAFLRDARWRIRVHTANAIPVLAITFWTDATPETVFLGASSAISYPGDEDRTEHAGPDDMGFPPAPSGNPASPSSSSAPLPPFTLKAGSSFSPSAARLSLVAQYGPPSVPRGISLFITPVAHVCFRSLRLAAPDRSLFPAGRGGC